MLNVALFLDCNHSLADKKKKLWLKKKDSWQSYTAFGSWSASCKKIIDWERKRDYLGDYFVIFFSPTVVH